MFTISVKPAFQVWAEIVRSVRPERCAKLFKFSGTLRKSRRRNHTIKEKRTLQLRDVEEKCLKLSGAARMHQSSRKINSPQLKHRNITDFKTDTSESLSIHVGTSPMTLYIMISM